MYKASNQYSSSISWSRQGHIRFSQVVCIKQFSQVSAWTCTQSYVV